MRDPRLSIKGAKPEPKANDTYHFSSSVWLYSFIYFVCCRFVPSYLRLGSWNIVMFVTYEQIQRAVMALRRWRLLPFPSALRLWTAGLSLLFLIRVGWSTARLQGWFTDMHQHHCQMMMMLFSLVSLYNGVSLVYCVISVFSLLSQVKLIIQRLGKCEHFFTASKHYYTFPCLNNLKMTTCDHF